MLAVGYTLWAAQDLLLPVLLGMFFALVGNPIIRFLQRLHVPRFVAALMLVVGGITGAVVLGNQLVVPASDWFRDVPKELREELKDDAPVGGGSWASAVEGYDDIARLGRPNSCSVVGSNGFTGCTAALLRDWFEARRAAR